VQISGLQHLNMPSSQVQFSVLSHAAWAPGVVTRSDWLRWAAAPFVLSGTQEAAVSAMPPMLRRRAGFLGKMALDVAYQCLAEQTSVPTVFCSRHGDVMRALALLDNVVDREPMSPTNFGLAVHNANAGLFSIARSDQASHVAISAGQSTVEHGVIEACALLDQGAERVLLVVCDPSLPPIYAPYLDCVEQPHAWAWLLAPAGGSGQLLTLGWSAPAPTQADKNQMPTSLQVLQFYLNQNSEYVHQDGRRQWRWSRHA